ncbi:MAG: hypothetical protein MK182_07405 [Acidimicrobiales bacterium]|nr:hypothetical protein [Acidimicrobiales bacterium]
MGRTGESSDTSDGESPEAVDYRDLMRSFRRALRYADAEQFAAVVGEGFEWHNHWFPTSDPVPTGKVLHGIDEMVTELERRGRDWTDLEYEGYSERYAPRFVTQTFSIAGSDRGRPFAAAVVDLYTLNADDLIVMKDTYWKYPVG